MNGRNRGIAGGLGAWIDPWIQRLRGLGDSLLAVLRAELAALRVDLARSGRHLGVALGLLGAALALFFWLLGLLIALLVAVLYVWLPLWASILAVLLLFATIAGVLVGLGWRHLRRVENPVDSVRRRVDDHLDWWQNQLLRDKPAIDVPRAAGSRLDEDEEDLP